MDSDQIIGIDKSNGNGKTVLVVRVGSHIKFFRELFEGEDWRLHPSGNGILVTHPDRPPVWCRYENDQYRQDFITPSESEGKQS